MNNGYLLKNGHRQEPELTGSRYVPICSRVSRLAEKLSNSFSFLSFLFQKLPTPTVSESSFDSTALLVIVWLYFDFAF